MSNRKIPKEIPSDHPFSRFLVNLPVDPFCDPFPDIIESATACRYFIGFLGQNASARQALFVQQLKKPSDNGAQLVTQHFGSQQSRAVIFLTRFSPVYSQVPFEEHYDASDNWLAVRPASISVSPTALEGCFQVPSL